jgi:tRNA(Glu) U13 pseudouridine synthase TruD
LKKIKKDFLIGNYFGEQRFDERVAEFSNFVEKKDFENAFKNIVCASSIRDSEKSKQIKEIISKNWGNWKKIIENELIAGTKKELPFKHLLEKKIIENSNKNQNENKKDEDYFGAILCCEPKALKWLLKGCQALRFNQVLAKEALTKKPNNKFITIAGLKLGVFANNAFKREISIEANELEKAFGLNGLSRKTFFTPKRVSVKKIKEKNKKENEKENENKKAKQDTLNITPENTKLVNTEISFDLGTGNYATIVLDAMKAFLE